MPLLKLLILGAQLWHELHLLNPCSDGSRGYEPYRPYSYFRSRLDFEQIEHKMSLLAAIETATLAHAGGFRESAPELPYITHPIEVLTNLRFVGGITDEEMLCAAVLHDTVEAGTLSPKEIGNKFGPRVQALVVELTRKEPATEQLKGLTKEEIWRVRADMLVDEIAKMSDDAQQIKLADRLANVRDAFRTKKGRKLRLYLEQTRKVLEVAPRVRNKGLWDAIDAELSRN